MFLVNQTIKSKRTGFRWVVLGYDEPTLDGAEVVMVRSAENNEVVTPALAHNFESLED